MSQKGHVNLAMAKSSLSTTSSYVRPVRLRLNNFLTPNQENVINVRPMNISIQLIMSANR